MSVTVLAGKYRLGERIGGGGMAEVLRAETIGAEGFARKVAVKRVLGPLSKDPRFGDMFVNEARLASLLHHPNVVSVLDFDRDREDCYYLVMELVHGLDLRRLADSGRLPVHVSAFVIAEVLRGLAYAHELVHDGRHLGLVHRDMSPHNVMVSWSGAVKVVDFGIAKAFAATDTSRTRSLKGKIAYMSPEQARHSQLDGRSDVFAVGVMLHELLTGQRLFDGATEAEVLGRLLTQPIPLPSQRTPDVPPSLDELVMSMLERDREQRVGSATLALNALLSSGTMSPRGGVDLVETLQARFPHEIPPSADVSGPVVTSRAASASMSKAVVQVAGPPEVTRTASAKRAPRRSRASLSVSVAAAVIVLGTAGWLATGGRTSSALSRTGQSETASGDSQHSALSSPPSMSLGDGAVPSAPPISPSGAVTMSSGAVEPAAETRASRPGVITAKPDAAPAPAKRVRRRAVVPGTLKVLVEPWALVTIDGKSHGQTPVIVDLPPGRHRVEIVNQDFNRKESVRVKLRSRRTEVIRRKWGVAY